MVVVAPFITLKAFESVMRDVGDDVTVVVVTRWVAEELAMGVSDCRIYESLSTRPNAIIYLLPNLHAKYYRSDNSIIIGSANVTGRALSDGLNANFEVLSPLPINENEINRFESELLRHAEPVTPELYKKTLLLQNELRRFSPDKIDYFEVYHLQAASQTEYWSPSISEPKELFAQYLKLVSGSGIDELGAKQELNRWKPPFQLNEADFDEFISEQIGREPITITINKYLSSRERRFGEVAKFLADELALETRGSDEWDILLEWLLYFRSSDYSYRRNPHSELVQYIGHHR